ncbi:conserved exported hypothetical protein [Verrucomicrobia bacterium]|nr:conserved exported hypothetical protein [Verrucomicrobiota bacterium]
MSSRFKIRMRQASLSLAAMAMATGLWLPCLHLVFRRPLSDFYQEKGISPKAKQLAARHLQLWTDPALRQAELRKMRSSNAEWDFMGRSFLVWSLVNMAMREPQLKAHYLPVIDEIIQETVKIEQQDGIYAFLMPYAKNRPYVIKPARSLFIDGEIALMMGARRMLNEEPAYRKPMTERLNLIEQRWRANPIMAAESYPDECWTFDHAVALAAFKVADRLDGSDHSALCQTWIAIAKKKLVDKASGLLLSTYENDGAPLYGPEGSTIWMVAHCLQVVDEAFARDQYQRARKELGRITLGFGYGLEWPASWEGPQDIDSGMVIPGFGVSAGSSGMAFMAASSFGDWDFLRALTTTLDMAAFPSRHAGQLKYCASNQVGDATILYASVLRPLWEKTLRPGGAR